MTKSCLQTNVWVILGIAGAEFQSLAGLQQGVGNPITPRAPKACSFDQVHRALMLTSPGLRRIAAASMVTGFFKGFRIQLGLYKLKGSEVSPGQLALSALKAGGSGQGLAAERFPRISAC